MAQLVVRNLDEGVKQRLKDRARRHGRTMEAEARAIIEVSVQPKGFEPTVKLGQLAVELFRDVGLRPGEALDELPRGFVRSPFDDDHR